MTRTGSECAALFSDFSLDDFNHDSENARMTYSRLIYTPKGLGDLIIELNIKVSNYSFDIPLTIALVTVLSYILKLKWNSRTIMEIIALILLTHFCYIFFYTSLQLFYYSHPEKIRLLTTTFKQYFLEFMWTFIDNILIRLETFVIALYLVFKKSQEIQSKQNLSMNWTGSKCKRA